MSNDDGEHEESGGGEEPRGGPFGELASGASDALGGLADVVDAADDASRPHDESTHESDDAEPGGAHDAAEALRAASDAAEAAAKTAETAESLRSAAEAFERGDTGRGVRGLGDGLGSLGGALGSATEALGRSIPDAGARRTFEDISRVATGVGRAARGLGRIVEGAIDLVEEATRTEVAFHLAIEGEHVGWHVRAVHLDDSIGRLPHAEVEARCGADEVIDEEDLLGKNAHLTIERGDHQRSFRGVVRHARVQRLDEELAVSIEITPALWLLSQGMDSRIYQHVTVPDLVEQIVSELLSSMGRRVERQLTHRYDAHEYLVQHRESHYELITRLCDEEGIFFYFDHDGDENEILVLADSNDNRPLIRGHRDGSVDYEQNESRVSGREVAYGIHRARRMGPTDVTVRDRDWTNPALSVEHARTGRGNWNGPPLELYDHHHAVRYHAYDEGARHYRAHTADRRSRLHAERLDIARCAWTVRTTVVTAEPGHVFELHGTDDHDGRYLIVSAVASGSTGEHGGEYHNTLSVLPVSVPYRPPAPARRVMPGPETAVVTGPPGEEIHTDAHGRVKVQFHWDRRGRNDEHSSAWIRVAQGWAGPGFGSLFIPRIGMEVVVSFLGGDPDRPVITGCLYNGANPPPYALPDEKTKSTIKTNSSIGGRGYNELRFEDKSGSEEIYIHAQKDFNEVVEHDHSTHVKRNQTNTVDHDQTETIRHDQTLHVENDRTKTVDVDEKNVIQGNRHTTVGPNGGNDTLWVMNDRTERVDGAEDRLTVTAGDKFTSCRDGMWEIDTNNRFQVIQRGVTQLTLEDNINGYTGGDVVWVSGHGAVRCAATSAGVYQLRANHMVQIAAVESDVQIHAGKEMFLDAPTLINISSAQRVVLQCGTNNWIKLDSSGIEIQGTTIKINSSVGATEIDAATQVKIKC